MAGNNANRVTWIEMKGKAKAEHQGYVYYHEKNSLKNPALKFFCCERNRMDHCKARMHVEGDAVVKLVGQHVHAPDGTRKQVLKVIESVKRRAADTEETTMAIVAKKDDGFT